MKKLFFIILTFSYLFADTTVSILGGVSGIDKSFTYKGSTNNFKDDLGIDKLYIGGLRLNYMHKTTYLPDIFVDYLYFTSLNQTNTLNRDIIVDNTTFMANDTIKSKFNYNQINIAGYYSLFKNEISYLSLGAGFYGVIGSLNIESNTTYSKQNFKFYYPALFVKYTLETSHIRFGYYVFGASNDTDHLYNFNIYLGYKIDTLSFNIGYNRTRMKIKDYDSWYSDITTSGAYFEIMKKF